MGKLGLDRGADGAKADGLDGVESDLLVQDLVVVGGLQNSNTIFQQKVSSAMAVHYDGIALPVVLVVVSLFFLWNFNPMWLPTWVDEWMQLVDPAGVRWVLRNYVE